MGAPHGSSCEAVNDCSTPNEMRAWNAACSFFDSERAAVFDVRPVDVILVKQHIVELSPINHFSALHTLVEVPFLRFAQLVKVSGIHDWDATSLAFASQGRSRCLYPFRASSSRLGVTKFWTIAVQLFSGTSFRRFRRTT
jgi:hypothetical protein